MIINADAIQVYEDIPILTSQPTIAEQDMVPHKLYGFVDANKRYSVANWLNDVRKEIDHALKKNLTPVIVGGTGMYISSLINGIRIIDDVPDKVSNQTTDKISKYGIDYLYKELLSIDKDVDKYIKISDTHRIIRAYNLYQAFNITPTKYRQLPNKPFYHKDLMKVFAIIPDRDELYQNCEIRFDNMFDSGAVDEVNFLIKKGYDLNSPVAKAIGFKELYNYLNGNMTKQQAIDKAKQNTRNYAKRQITWFQNQLNNVDNIKQDNIVDLIKNINKLVLC